MTLADRFRIHADGCDAMGARLYGVLMRGMADDWEAGGVVRGICAGWEDASLTAAVPLRLLGGLHRIVLTGSAPELLPYYRNLGGSRPPGDAWPVALEIMKVHQDTLHADLDIAPQTNEAGRAAGLVLVLYAAVRQLGLRRVRLLEVGASAGLNLLVDHYRVVSGDWAWGPPDSPVVIDGEVRGPVTPEPVQIVGRRGCDLHPVDPRSEAGKLRLRSFVWPDDVVRYRRLDGALKVADRFPVTVDRSDVVPWLRERLAEPVPADVVTVVWHSVVWQYLDTTERDDAEGLLAAAANHMPLVHAQMELLDSAPRALLSTTTYGEGGSRTTRVGESHPHGMPIRMFSG